MRPPTERSIWRNDSKCHESRAELFQARATECYQAAQKSKDPKVKQNFMELMASWTELAARVEDLDRNRLKS
jgi:hypothetical protein